MRRIADLTPGSARTDRRDAAVIAQAARTMPHTLRDVTAADEEAASLTMPAGSGPGPGAPGRPRPRAASGACTTQTPPRPRGRPGTPPGPRRGPGGHSGLAHPHRTEEGRQGTYRCQAEEARSPAPCRLGPAGLRSPEEADRDGGRHRRGRGGPAPPGPPGSSPCTLRGPISPTVSRPWRAAPPSLARSPPPVPGIGVPAAAVFLAETLGRTPATGAQLASYAGLAPVTRRSGSSIRGERRLPRRQQAAQDSHARLRLRLPALRPRQPRLLPAQTRPGKRPGQAATALAHRRVLTLHAMIRNGTLYDPQPAAQLPTAA